MGQNTPNNFKSTGITHAIRASKTGEADKIRGWLELQTWKGQIGSPLAPFANQIAKSPYWSLILAICYQEQNHCISAPSWNFWGMGPGKIYNSAEESITDIDYFLWKHEENHPTIESFRAWYCYAKYNESHICPEWEPSILNIMKQLESL